MDLKTLEFLHSLVAGPGSSADWKTAFDQLLVAVREEFIYDHVALYLLDRSGRTLDVGYARAIGRGRTAEADINWGEEMAGKVVASPQTIIQEPDSGPQKQFRKALQQIPLRDCPRSASAP